jgi:hypothetical protein
MLRVRFFFPLLIALAALAAACGGGAGNSVLPGPTPTPHSGPTAVPVGPTPQTVRLSGDGYTLSFTVPAVVTGSTTTMSATLQTQLPSGTIAPQAAKRGYTAPRPLATIFSGLVYLVVSTTDTVGFSSAPSFEYTLPAGVSVPSGSKAYLLYWDPYVSGSTGWITLLGPGNVSGHNVSFPPVKTGVQLNANTPYDYALAITTQTVPTATPAPTPTPTVNPSASPSRLPAYCANYQPPSWSSGALSSPQPVVFNDQSGTGAHVYFYVLEGADAGGQTRYLGADGKVHAFSSGATAPPLPLECFPGSLPNGKGKQFALPAPPTTGYGANLYIAYATPVPGDNAPPSPLTFTGTSDGGYQGPSLDPTSPLYASAPFEFVEYQLPSATLDVTQVDKVGLPLLLEQNSKIYGDVKIGFASSAAYQNLADAIGGVAYYKNLRVGTQLNNRRVLARILAPQDAAPYGFPQDWWYNSNYNASQSANALGYLGYMLAQYKTSPQLYTTQGLGAAASGHNYCASSDGSANFLFYDVGSGTSCSSLTGTPITMNTAATFKGNTEVDGVCQSVVFAMPYGPGDFPGGSGDAFYLWKAMVLEMNRGVALVNTTHPVNGWATAPTPLPPFGNWYPSGQVFNTYAELVHQYMNNHNAYAVPYDEPGGYAPTTTSDANATLQLTVWNIPPAPSTSATPDPAKSCPP